MTMMTAVKENKQGLYTTVSEELALRQNFEPKQGARDEIKTNIKDYLWNEKAGLPESFGRMRSMKKQRLYLVTV